MLKPPPQVQAIGIPWYEREDYARILEIMEDADLLPGTFEKWLYSADKAREKFMRTGAIVVKAHVKPDEFAAWCKVNNQRLNAQGRMNFGNFVAYQYALKAQR
jgi:hypothetical protein